jgi:hypothetical protein
MDIEAYTRMYLWDTEFRDYANKEYAVDDFIERFVVELIDDHKMYRINNIKYHKYDDGCEFWYMNDQYHRDNGPAIVHPDGSELYYYHGMKHRLDGPAVVYPDGYRAYYVDNNRHRLDGPAVIYVGGSEEYWEYGERVLLR